MLTLTAPLKAVQDVGPLSEDRLRKLDIAINVDCVCKTSSCLTIMAGPELKEPLRGCNMRLLGPLSQRSQEEKLEMHPLKRHRCHHHRAHHRQKQQEEAEIQRRGRCPDRSDRESKSRQQWELLQERRWRKELDR